LVTWNPRSAILAGLVFALAIVAATGCGGGGSRTGSTGSAQTAGSAAGSAQASTSASTVTSPSSPAREARTAAGSAPTSGQSTIEAANAICARRNGELAQISLSGVNLHAVGAAARNRARIEVRALGELQKLTPSTTHAASYRQLLALDRAAVLRVVGVGERARAGDAAGVRVARARASGGRLPLLIAAAQAGLRECSGITGLE